MGRHRPRLTAVLLVLVCTACTKTGSPAGAPTTTTTTATRATPSASGYPLAKGRQVQVSQGQTGNIALAVGDVLAVHRPAMGTRPSGDSLVLADVTDSQLIYQAVSAGKATLATDDPPPPPTCQTTPCPPGRAAPPVVTVDISG
jgi:hypothetical protein